MSQVLSVLISPDLKEVWDQLTPREQHRAILADLIVGVEKKLVDVMVFTDMAPSKTQARTLIKQGGVSIGPDRTRVDDVDSVIIFLFKKRSALPTGSRG